MCIRDSAYTDRVRTSCTGDGITVEIAGFFLEIIHGSALQHVDGSHNPLCRMFASCERDALRQTLRDTELTHRASAVRIYRAI